MSHLRQPLVVHRAAVRDDACMVRLKLPAFGATLVVLHALGCAGLLGLDAFEDATETSTSSSSASGAGGSGDSGDGEE